MGRYQGRRVCWRVESWFLIRTSKLGLINPFRLPTSLRNCARGTHGPGHSPSESSRPPLQAHCWASYALRLLKEQPRLEYVGPVALKGRIGSTAPVQSASPNIKRFRTTPASASVVSCCAYRRGLVAMANAWKGTVPISAAISPNVPNGFIGFSQPRLDRRSSVVEKCVHLAVYARHRCRTSMGDLSMKVTNPRGTRDRCTNGPLIWLSSLKRSQPPARACASPQWLSGRTSGPFDLLCPDRARMQLQLNAKKARGRQPLIDRALSDLCQPWSGA
jgi:hypothetical protein